MCDSKNQSKDSRAPSLNSAGVWALFRSIPNHERAFLLCPPSLEKTISTTGHCTSVCGACAGAGRFAARSTSCTGGLQVKHQISLLFYKKKNQKKKKKKKEKKKEKTKKNEIKLRIGIRIRNLFWVGGSGSTTIFWPHQLWFGFVSDHFFAPIYYFWTEQKFGFRRSAKKSVKTVRTP